MVLIARLDEARTLYAVERESRGLYVLCQLGSWVNLQELRAAAVASKQELPKRSQGLDSLAGEPSLPTITPEINKYNKKKRLAIEAIQSMVKRPISNLLTESQSDSPTVPPEAVSTSQSHTPEQHNVEPVVDEVISPLTAPEIAENLRTQYFEALYLSKASCTSCLNILVTNPIRLLWHISRKVLYHELELPSTWTLTRLLT